MLKKFSLYGFLKNQQYYEPFMLLAFLEAGMSFLDIGLLVAFREILTNIFEIPSGAIADSFGRRRVMIISIVFCIISFITFGYASVLKLMWLFYPAMFLFSISEACRTGTHKAIILDYLHRENRLDEKVNVYGYTRSWAKIGSAVSSFISIGIVLYSKSFIYIFWFSIPPYFLNLINLLMYPRSFDNVSKANAPAYRMLFNAIGDTWKNKPLRGLMFESMLFSGVYKITKDYVQPLVKTMVVASPLLLFLELESRIAILLGGVYMLLSVVAVIGSRLSSRLVAHFNSQNNAASFLWRCSFYIFIIMGLALYSFPYSIPITIALFFFLELIQNLWRPQQISRLHEESELVACATMLSIESQGKSLVVAIFAPPIGLCVDMLATASATPSEQFLPIAVLGVFASLAGIIVLKKTHR